MDNLKFLHHFQSMLDAAVSEQFCWQKFARDKESAYFRKYCCFHVGVKHFAKNLGDHRFAV